MDNKFILNLENRLHGFHTRLKELHFSAPSISIHTIIDNFDRELSEFDDSIMEDAQGVLGFIQPGEISPILPVEKEILGLLGEIRDCILDFYDDLDDAPMWIGIKSEVENFIHVIHKTIYLIKIGKNEG